MLAGSPGSGTSKLTRAGVPEDKRTYSSVYNNDKIGTGHARSVINSAQGWSASGPGGIVYAVVAAAAPAAPVEAAACQLWTATAGHTSATVRDLPAPALEAAHTVGMATAATTVVEGGTETRADADTFVAHLGQFVCFVALVTDPGSAYPRLDAAFAADLLVETVSALRS